MNFIGRHDHLSGYERVNGAFYGTANWNRDESNTSFIKQSYSWKWRKGSRVSTINDWLQIKIGGDDEVKKKKSRQALNRVKSTKYSLLSFLPLNLLEQFRRIANFYFLVMTIISCLIDSPISPMTSFLPLVFVISVTAAKQGYEDILRYRTDNIVNCSPVTVIRNGVEEHIQSQYVAPGDLVVVERDCDVPCDLVLLRSTDPHGKCFITTANLDGESNLKTLMVPRDLPLVEITKMHKLGVIECESAQTDLYSFNGKIELSGGEGRILPLTTENLLLRGSRVKNTECVIGCAVYTGMLTKLQLNSRLTRNKSASSETYINRFLMFILAMLIVIVTVLYFLKRYEELFVIAKLSYLGPAADGYSIKQFLQDYLSFLILFNYLIPISLYVTIEMQRIISGFFMEWDRDLYDEETDQTCIVNTSNLNEELGQINLLFSDKTGTLTKNEMVFQQCSINGRKYMYKKTRLQETESGILYDINKFNKDQKIFFQALTICHTVQVAAESSNESNDVETNKTISNGTEKKSAKKAYSIFNITEESRSSSQHSETSLDNSILLETSLSTDPKAKATSDVNPLLDESKLTIERRKRPTIVKRSPNFTRAATRIHPVSMPPSIALDEIADLQHQRHPISSPSALQYFPKSRLDAFHFQRSSSEIDLPECGRVAASVHGGHKRSQSYGTPMVNVTNQMSPISGTILRTLSTISRESYAAENFQRHPTLLIRAESQRRKNEIAEVVNNLDYQASSPDEKALIEASANLGLVYMGDDDEILRVRIVPPHMDYSRPFADTNINELHFDRLHVLEFTSDRKRMSVIIKDENGIKWIYTKGAESYVFPLCAQSCSDLITKTDAHISDFARHGLRTLAVARKRLTEAEYRDFVNGLNIANCSLENRKELSAQCYAKIECNLDLLGATAVEDALQDDVADTLISLQKAGIRTWVLTGDKVETAMNIALSCGHIPQNSLKYFIIDCPSKEHMLTHLDALYREVELGNDFPCSLLIDGKSLNIALTDVPNEFRDIAIKCTAVLCCRLSPLQKSQVVSLIKTSNGNFVTAAIGDGANDVSMIQEAHVGIGIMGKEGRQAARCADFSFAKFSKLKRLLLVHGHYHTTRLSFLVLYFFYKNIIFMGIMFLFQFYSLFSSSSVYDSIFLTLFNVLYTCLPIYLISLTEKPFKEEVLMSDPHLYIRNTNNKLLHWPYFFTWVLSGVYHCLVIFYFTYLVFSTNNIILNVGQTAEFSCFGTLMIELVVIIANLKIFLESKYLSYWYMISIAGSIMIFILTTLVYNVVNLRYDTDIYWSYNNLLSSIPIWFFKILTIVACFVPDFTCLVLRRSINLPTRAFFPGKESLHNIRLRRKVESTQL